MSKASKFDIFAKGDGWMPADEASQKFRRKYEEGEVITVTHVRIRDPVAHRRYWKLMTMCAENCEQIEIRRGAIVEIRNKDDMHTAVKLCLGYTKKIFDDMGAIVAEIPLSTAFEEMSTIEWDEYYPRVLDVVAEKVLPGIEIPEIEFELMKLMGLAGGNA